MNGSIWLMLCTAAGAIIALLYTTARRKALRVTVQTKSYTDLQRLHAEWQQARIHRSRTRERR